MEENKIEEKEFIDTEEEVLELKEDSKVEVNTVAKDDIGLIVDELKKVESLEDAKNVFQNESIATGDSQTTLTEAEAEAKNDITKLVEPEEFEIREFSTEKQYDVKFKPEDCVEKEGKIYFKKAVTIDRVEIPAPKTRDADGNFIPPQPFKKDKPNIKGYEVKAKIYYKDINYVSIISKIRYYANVDKVTGKKILNKWLDTKIDETNKDSQFKSTLSKIYYKYCIHQNVKPGSIMAVDFLNQLVGKEVLLEQWSEFYEGSTRYRVDIAKFMN